MPTLTKKIGPLPTWAWVGVGLLFVGMVFYFRRSQDSGDGAEVAYTPDGSQIAGSLPGSESQYIGSSDGSLHDSLAGSSYDYSAFDTGTPVGYPPDFLSGLLAGLQGSGLSGGPMPIYEPPTDPFTTNPAGTSQGTQAVATKSQKQTSFTWAGKVYTKKDEAAFRAYLKKTGVAYSTWAKNHPQAAKDVFGKMV